MVDLKGRLSNPLKIAEACAAQGLQQIGDPREVLEIAGSDIRDDPSEAPRKEKGRLSNPPQRRLSPTDIGDLNAAYQGGATISQLAAEFGIHRTTVAAHLERRGATRRGEQAARSPISQCSSKNSS